MKKQIPAIVLAMMALFALAAVPAAHAGTLDTPVAVSLAPDALVSAGTGGGSDFAYSPGAVTRGWFSESSAQTAQDSPSILKLIFATLGNLIIV